MLQEKTTVFHEIREIIDHPIKLRIHKSEDIFDILNKHASKLVTLKDEDFDISLDDKGMDKGMDKDMDKGNDTLIIRNIYDLEAIEIYNKLLKSFIELLIIYDISDYDRFLQIDISLTKINQLLNTNELLITYSDIIYEYYLEHFIRYSKYIRNVDLYGEGINQKKLTQINKQKDKSKQELSFVKQYPQIIRTLFGRELTLLKYVNETLPEIQLISDILSDVVDIMSVEIIQSLLQCELDHTLNESDLELIANKYDIGICLVSTIQTKRLEHDVIIKLPRNDIQDETQMILLYQYDNTLIHIQKKEEDTVRLGDITSKLFMKHLQYIK